MLPAYRHAGEAAAAAAEVVPEGGAPVDPTAAAFFDVDNTVMRGASIFHFAVGLARRRFFDARQVVDFGRGRVYQIDHIIDTKQRTRYPRCVASEVLE